MQHLKALAHGAGSLELPGHKGSPGKEELIHVSNVWSFDPIQGLSSQVTNLIYLIKNPVSLLFISHSVLYLCPGVLVKQKMGINCCSFSWWTLPKMVLTWKGVPSFAAEMLWIVYSLISVDCNAGSWLNISYQVSQLKHNKKMFAHEWNIWRVIILIWLGAEGLVILGENRGE